MASRTAHLDRVHPRQATGPWNLGALEYLQQSLDQKRPLAFITGQRGSGKAMLLRRFLQYRTGGPVAFSKTPTESPAAFLELILLQFGLEAHDSSLNELRSLAMVFFRHQASKGSRPIIVVENAQAYGPLVFELIEIFSRLEIDGESALLFILTGTRDLSNRVDMLHTADRCDLDALNAMPTIAKKTADQHYGHLEVRLGDNLLDEYVIDRRQISIGRKRHNDICLTGRFVSRHHAVLIGQPSGVYIVDLKSTNGLCVNEEPVRSRALVNGDVISISNYRIVFVDDAAASVEPETENPAQVLSPTVAMRRQVGETLPKLS